VTATLYKTARSLVYSSTVKVWEGSDQLLFSYNLEWKRWWSNDLIGHAKRTEHLTLSVNKSRRCFKWDCIWCSKIWSLSTEPIERYIQVFAVHKLRFFCWKVGSGKFYCYITKAKFLHCMCSTCFVALRTKYITFIVQYFTSWLKEWGKTLP